MTIRRAGAGDAAAVSALIKSVAHYFTLHPRGLGAQAFLQGIEAEPLATLIAAPNFLYFVGLVGPQLAGAVALREHTHLHHLFVAPAFQGRGLSRALWRHAQAAAIAAGNRGGFTLNATPYALPVYQRFGFQASGPRVETNGIAFIPMRLAPAAGR